MIARLYSRLQEIANHSIGDIGINANSRGEFEMKYTFQNTCALSLINYFAMHYSPDKDYPAAKIQSIYMENMEGSSYKEKINSDFLKTKYRIRWYENSIDSLHSPPSSLFLEKKMKVGSKREKRREEVSLPSSSPLDAPLHSSKHKYWQQCFLKRGLHENREPIIQISYMRNRYAERHSETRINLDYNIKIEKVNPLYLPKLENILLPHGVLEIKRKCFQPPESLAYITQNVVKKSDFSKYEQCISLLKNIF